MVGLKKRLHVTVTQNGQTLKRSFEVSAVIVGRSPECLIQLNHVDVSRKHLNLYVREGEVWIEDMGSSNGTFLNATQLKPMVAYRLTAADALTVGKATGIVISAEVDKPLEVKSSESTVSMTPPKPPEYVEKVAPEKLINLEASIPDIQNPHSPDPRQKVLRTSQEEAAEIIRNARIQAERETQSIFERAQNTQKQAEEFYRRRLQEASTDAEELRSDVRHECETLLAKTRQSCEDIRKQVDTSVTELRTKTRQECDQMYEEMEAQVKQVKEHRIHEMEEGISRKELEILEDARKRMEIAEKELQQNIESSRALHQHSIKVEMEQHLSRLKEIEDDLQFTVETKIQAHAKNLEEETTEHREKIAEENQEHESRLLKERKEHEEKISSELLALQQKIANEYTEHNAKITLEIKEHALRIAQELEEHRETIKCERLEHETKILNESQEHEIRLAKELSQHEQSLAEAQRLWDERKTEEMQNHSERIRSEVEMHQEGIKKEREDFSSERTRLTEENHSLAHAVAELKSESERLAKVTSELSSTEAGLQNRLATMGAENKKLENQSAELRSQVEESTKALEKLKKEYELLHRSHQVLVDKKSQAQADFDGDVLRLKAKLQAEKDRHIKEEKENLLYLKQESEKKIQQAEKELLGQIERKKHSFIKEILLEIEKSSALVSANLNEWRKEGAALEKGILAQLEGQLFTMKVDGSSGTQNIDITQHKRKERYVNLAYGCALGVLIMLSYSFGVKRLEGPSPLERAVASEAEERKRDLENRKFDPVKEYELKNSYVDAVLYTQQYYELTTTDAYQEKWSLALAKHMLKLWKVDEDSSLQVASIANALVKTIEERKGNIHPDYVQEGLKKMNELETESVKRMVAILGSQVRYESLKKFEHDFFTKYRNELPQ